MGLGDRFHDRQIAADFNTIRIKELSINETAAKFEFQGRKPEFKLQADLLVRK